MSLSHSESPVCPQRRAATYQDVLDAPPNMVAEIINGVLYTMPRPFPPHAETHVSLVGWVHWFFGRSGGGGGEKWRILAEPELHLGKNVLVPDIAGWRLPRMSRLPKAKHITVAPDWVCEVLSESTRSNGNGPKKLIYPAHGVKFYWLVDPITHNLEVLVLENGVWSLVGSAAGDAEVRMPPFEQFPLRLDDLWADIFNE